MVRRHKRMKVLYNKTFNTHKHEPLHTSKDRIETELHNGIIEKLARTEESERRNVRLNV